jgi:hypothetical protein
MTGAVTPHWQGPISLQFAIHVFQAGTFLKDEKSGYQEIAAITPIIIKLV